MDKIGYNAREREGHWQKFWQDRGVYHFDPESDKTLFTVDTPPPTISGALHLGHVFSYTQAEVVVRFFRMAGANVRYPFCLDNNGLPTERLVEKEKGFWHAIYHWKNSPNFVLKLLKNTKKVLKIFLLPLVLVLIGG